MPKFSLNRRWATTGNSRQHKPQMQERLSTHSRITSSGASALSNLDLETVTDTVNYCLSLSPDAFATVLDFAFRAMIEGQYERWENAIEAGASPENISDESLLMPSAFQEIYLRLIDLQECVDMAIGGIKVIYDTGVSEIITVAAAHARGYTDTFQAGASDSDFFLVVHVLPSEVLSDTNYGADSAQVTDYVGRILVQDGLVRYQAPKKDVVFDYGGTVLDTVQTVQGGSLGQWTQLRVAMPMVIGSSEPPCNDCSGTTPYPPTPPTPPTPPAPPSPPVPPPTPPVPTKPISSDTSCSRIYFDNGYTLGLRFGTIGAEFRLWGNIPILHEVYPVRLETAIHDWIVTNVPDFDFDCDRLDAIKMTLLCSYTSPDIFGLIPNPVPINNETPRILAKYGADVEPVFFFPNDRQSVQPIEPPSLFPTFKENFCEQEHTIAIRQKDRLTGIGYETWGFEIDVADFVTEISRTPLDLQMCGIVYKPHQYLVHFKFDGTDPIKTFGTSTLLYDQYENGRIGVSSGFFITSGFIIGTDAVHGFSLTIDMICPLKANASNYYVYGRIKVTRNHWGGSTIRCASLGEFNSTVANAPESYAVSEAGGPVDFYFTMPFSYLAGHQYNFHIFSDSFPDDEFSIEYIIAYCV